MMDRSIRAVFWVLAALVLLSSFSTIWFFIGKEELFKEYIKLQDTFKTTIEKFTEELKVANNEKLKVQEKLDAVYSQLKSIEKERNTLKSEHEEALEQNASLRKELARLSKEGTGLKSRLKELESEEFIARLIRENASLQVKLESLKEKQILAESLKNIEVERGLLEERLREANSIAEVLTRDLLKEKGERTGWAAQIEQIRLENNILKSQVAEAERRNFELQKNLALKVSSLEGTIRDKENEIERMRVALKETQEARAEAYKRAESVELPPIIVTTERTEVAKSTVPPFFGSDRSTSSKKGKIITVNREHNFVVIDLGEKDGVRVGTRFSVYRGERELGTLEVIQTRERIAAADIKETNTGPEIMPDDIVVMQ